VGKREMKLLSVIKSICVMIGVAVASDAYAMEQELRQQRELELFNYEHTADKFMRELPLMSLNLKAYRYSCCSDAVKQNIDTQLRDEKNKFLAGIVTYWEPLCNALFVNNKGKKNKDNGVLYKGCLNVPIREIYKVFDNYSWAIEVYNGKEASRFFNSMAKSEDTWNIITEKFLKNGYIVRYADQIKKINCYFEDELNYYTKGSVSSYPLANRSVLEAFNLFFSKIKQMYPNDQFKVDFCVIAYYCCDTYTLKNVFNKFKNQREILSIYILCVMPIVTTWLSRFIKFNYCQKFLTENDIRSNEKAILFNEGLDRVRGQWSKITKDQLDPFFLQYAPYLKWNVSIKQSMEIIESYYSWIDWFKINAPFFTGCFLINFPELLSFLQKGRIFLYDGSVHFIWALFYGCILKFLSWLHIASFPLGVVGVLGSVTAIFFGLACVKSMVDIRNSYRDTVILKDISTVIKRCNDGHIVIQ
jgi:hypothetical protein